MSCSRPPECPPPFQGEGLSFLGYCGSMDGGGGGGVPSQCSYQRIRPLPLPAQRCGLRRGSLPLPDKGGTCALHSPSSASRTNSLADVLTDLVAEPVDFELPSLGTIQAHKGMLMAAQRILAEICNVLQRAAEERQDYSVVVLGHSLGAGTAALLALLLREGPQGKAFAARVQCYAYSPPGGLLSHNAVQHSTGFTYSVVLGADLVPRLHIQNIKWLLDQVLLLLLLRTGPVCPPPPPPPEASGTCPHICGCGRVLVKVTTP